VSKKLVLCCDGTWNVPDQASPTNIVKLAMTVAARDERGREQRVFYHQGVGTTRGQRIRGGAFGMGLSRTIRECYAFLVGDYDPGDEIWIFGFSRGAFTARSIAGLIRNCGVLRRDRLERLGDAYRMYRSRDPDAHPRGTRASLFRRSYSHEPRVRFIGVFDTVGALGVPAGPLNLAAVVNRRWRFHDTALSSQVDFAYQALAIDERRGPFTPSLWTRQDPDGQPTHDAAVRGQVLEQVWFTGVHSDVGGGYADSALAEIPLLWMADRAAAAGLDFAPGAFSGLARPVQPGRRPEDDRAEGWFVAPDPEGLRHESRTGFLWTRLASEHVRRPCRETADADEVPTARWRGRPLWAPWVVPPPATGAATAQSIASSVVERQRRLGDAREPLAGELSAAVPPPITEVRTTPGIPRQ
jgi:hypothetical protein